MPLSFFNKIEISERMIPFHFIFFGLKFAFYDIFEKVPAYQYMAFMPEKFWSLIFVSFGLLQFFATQSKNLRWRRLMLFISSSVWAFWAGGIILAGSNGFGDIIWSGVALSCFWSYFRVQHIPLKK